MNSGAFRPGEDAVRRLAPRAPFDIRTPAIIVVSTVALSRVAAYTAGVRLESAFLWDAWQLLDLRWLREDLLGSLAALHSQPPLFNLGIGLLAIIVPGREPLVVQALHLALGFVLAFTMLDLLRRCGVSSGVAVAATLLVSVSPATLLYENWLFYPYPVAVLLVGAAWSLSRYAVSRTIGAGALAFTFMAVPALTWSLFHVVWLVAVILLVAACAPARSTRTFAAAAVPLLIVLSWYAKNAVVFGEPAASSWFGQNLYRAATAGLSAADRQRLVLELGIAPLAAVQPFSPVASYRPYLAVPTPTGVAALDEERKQSGAPNFNHLAYIAVSRRYRDLAIEIVRHRPARYLRTVASGFCRYCLPATQDAFLEVNRSRIDWADRLYGAVVYGQLRRPPRESDCRDWSMAQFPLIVPALLLASIAGPLWLISRTDAAPEVRLTLAFTTLTIVWTLIAGNLFEFGENNRFRFVVEPLMFVALAVSFGGVRVSGRP